MVACSAKNRFYRANRDLGRVFKTEFLLSYLSEPQLRARIRRGLLKVEQLHALARDVYYGRRGRINARELHEQMNSCSCLTLILACIIYWQAKQITQTVRSGGCRRGRHRRDPAPARQPDSNGTTSFSTASTSSIALWSASNRSLCLYFNTNLGRYPGSELRRDEPDHP